jgi:hypothetical protein
VTGQADQRRRRPGQATLGVTSAPRAAEWVAPSGPGSSTRRPGPHEDRPGDRRRRRRGRRRHLVLRAIGVATFDIPDDFEEIAPRPLILSTLGGVLAAGAAFAIVAKTARNPRRTYLAIVVVALLLSLWSPLTLDAETGAKATLPAMHVVTAAICSFVFSRSVRPSSA